MTEEIKKLYRSKKDRILFGVCGGLAEFFGIDATLVRVIFIILALVHGIGILVYLALWLLVPEKHEVGQPAAEIVTPQEITTPQLEERKVEAMSWFEKNRTTLGAGIIAIGFFILFGNWFSWHFLEVLFWPSIIILGGLFLIFRKK
ncbi:MAG: PspC domain-containing protein [Patescibacteria group bacterium]|jgi:phage shock protein C